MWKLALFLGGSILLSGGGFVAGWQVQAWRYGAAEAKATGRIVRVIEYRDRATAPIVVHDVQERDRIRYVTQTLVEKVPEYVTPEADARCVVPLGFVRVHDAAAAGLPTVVASADRAHDAPSGVELSTIAATVAGNYGTCNSFRQTLIDLQAWERARVAAEAVK